MCNTLVMIFVFQLPGLLFPLISDLMKVIRVVDQDELKDERPGTSSKVQPIEQVITKEVQEERCNAEEVQDEQHSSQVSSI